MRISYTAVVIAMTLAGCARQERPPNPASPAQHSDLAVMTAEAKVAVMALAGSLTSQLQAAMQAGGPVVALDVCHTAAPAMSASISQQYDMTVTRVSLRNRNPDIGVPNDWQTEILHDFEARKAAGKDPDSLVYAEIAGTEFRFMKAIPTAELCLNCHGSQLEPELVERLAELYPEDRAVGYREGDLRGAFVVTGRAVR